MKIKLSKSQWENIGKKAGWMKISQIPQKITELPKKVCPECHGEKFIKEKLKNMGTLDYNEHLIPCPTCNGKGYISKEDHDSYLHSMGVIPCPYGNDCKHDSNDPN